MVKILFICHGNICRSTMAEFVMKDLVKKAGLTKHFLIASAATTRDEIGCDTYIGTKEKLQAEKIPFTPRQAVQMQRSDYDKYDYIIAMDDENMRDILRICGDDSQGKVHKLLYFIHSQRNVADPWYTGDFDTTFKDIEQGCRALLTSIENKQVI